MKVDSIKIYSQNFTGKRQDRNTLEQLKKNNPYDLNVINQRNINNAIDNLSQVPGKDNVNFLLDVSKNLKYGTNIDLGKQPYNNWQFKLQNAARKAIELSPEKDRTKLSLKLDKITAKKPLSANELKILDLRDSILSKIDRTELKNIKNDNIKNFDNNFDYLITSSEIPIAHKVYILKKLDYLLSPEYKINELLADKKTQVAAEIVNDLVINTPESKIPNTKVVNQLQHGMCGAISICRKALAYEDKPHFIDIVLSELDNKPYMMVYDISKLGTKTKIPLDKPYIDYNYAMEKGYRILDAAALNWMSIADTTGSSYESSKDYVTFDKTYFDTFSDLHIMKDINEEMAEEQDYYRALLRSKATLTTCKKKEVLKDYQTTISKSRQAENIQLIQKYNEVLEKHLTEISPSISKEIKQHLLKDLRSLEAKDSSTLNKSNSVLKNYMYIKNEPEKIKINKIKNYLQNNLSDINNDKLNKLAPDILDLVTTINSKSIRTHGSKEMREINKARDLYAAAAAYRIQYDFGLDNKDRIKEMSKVLNLPDQESLIVQNMDNLINKLKKGTLNPEIKKELFERFVISGDGNPDEMLISTLEINKENFIKAVSEVLDFLHKSCLQESRKYVLLNNLTALKSAIQDDNDKTVLEGMAQELDLPADKRKILKVLDNYIDTLNSKNLTQEQYVEIYNKMGGKNQVSDFKATMEALGEILFKETASHSDVVKGFNLINGLPQDAPLEKTLEAYQRNVNNYNQLANLVATFQNVLDIRTPDGEILNTATPKDVIMKKLENAKEIISAKDLKIFQDKFTKIDNARIANDGTTIFLKDLPPELTKFSPYEKEVLKTIEKNINKWYSATIRNLSIQRNEYKKPFDELSRETGVKTGASWVGEEESGLSYRSEIRIFEHMTDRPYHVETDIKTALEKIKKLPYSGISNTSMQSNEPAMHAQYIVDLKPVTIKTPEGDIQKEALFHDNTWGSDEHENTWIDEYGLLRTDYSTGSGGETGFITDSNYRSGKLLENLLDGVGEFEPKQIDNKQYKKLTRSRDESYKFRMISEVIVPGEASDVRSTISAIKDYTLIPPDQYLDDLAEYAKNMTRDEVQQRIKKIELSGNDTQKTYSDIENRIWGNPPFVKGIETKEDYDKLANDDKLKLLFEEAAVLLSYKEIPELTKIYQEKPSLQNIQLIKNKIRKNARKNFDYSFGKDASIAIGGARNSANEIFELLTAYQMQTRVKISNSNIKSIIKTLEHIDKEKFDGNIDTTIDLMVDNFKNAMKTKTLNCKNKEQEINNLAEKVRAVLVKNMYFNKEDLKSPEFRKDNLPAIEKWIDDNFDPADDNEFVEIYNNMQKMTTAEFKEKYNYLIDDKVLGIKPLTGYDMLKKFRALDSTTENVIYNLLFYNDLYSITEPSKTIPSYEYSKLSRIQKGAKYADGKRSFDDIYIDYYYSLQNLTLDKIFGKYKDINFKKYGVLPAYAKVETEDKEVFNNGVMDLFSTISEDIEAIDTFKAMINSANNMKKLQKYIDRIDENATLKDSQRDYIIKSITGFYNEFQTDLSMKRDIENAENIIIHLVQNKPYKEIKPMISTLIQNITQYEKPQDDITLSDLIQDKVQNIKKEKFAFIMQVVDPKHQQKAFELLNKWISAKAKNLPDANMYYAEFEMFLDKYKIINSPDKMLNSYLLMLAKPTKDNNPYQGMTEEQKKEMETIKGIYEENIASLLYSANLVDIQTLLMRCARKGTLNLIKNELKNTKLPLKNGMVADLYSDNGLLLILKDIFDENELDTALLFIEQLGLGERVVEMYAQNTNFDNAKKCVKRIHSVLDAVDKQVKFIDQEVEKLADIDTDPNYKQRLEQAKNNMNKYCMNTNFRPAAKNVDKVMNAIIEELDKNPNQPKYKLITDNINYLKTKNIEFAKNYTGKLNSVLQQIQSIQALVKEIKLQRNSKAEKKRVEFFNKIADLQEFTQKYSTHYKNIHIYAGENTAEMQQL